MKRRERIGTTRFGVPLFITKGDKEKKTGEEIKMAISRRRVTSAWRGIKYWVSRGNYSCCTGRGEAGILKEDSKAFILDVDQELAGWFQVFMVLSPYHRSEPFYYLVHVPGPLCSKLK